MRRRRNTFYCFSPPVMLATLVIESCLALYTLWRYKLTVLTRLVVISLLMLALFQLCEYHVCTAGDLVGTVSWSKLGYVAITTLPPLGLHILHVLAGKPRRRLVYAAYATMIGFIVYFLSYHAAFTGYKCTGNYVIFQIGLWPARFYALYYYGWLLTAIGLAFYWAKQLGKDVRREAVLSLVVGYFVFLLPTAIVNTIKPQTRQGIPSIMCGFAVLFALVLTIWILPKMAERRSD